MNDVFRVSRRAELLEAEVDDEVLALHVTSGTCYGFNLTAGRIWSLLKSPRQVGELRAVLEAEFDVEPERCRTELMDLLRELEADGLIEIDAVDNQQ